MTQQCVGRCSNHIATLARILITVFILEHVDGKLSFIEYNVDKEKSVTIQIRTKVTSR